MKKILYFLCSIALLQSCEKEAADPTNIDAKKVTIGIAYEPVLDADTRVAIEENGDKFSLIWESTDNIEIATSTKNVNNLFTLSSYNGTSAVFTGTLPDAGTNITTTDYFAATSSFVSRSKTNDHNTLRLAIATNQEAAGTSIANSCILAGELSNCPVGTIDGTFALKTMNAFLKIPVTKGAAAAGSSNTYMNGMFLENVKIESIGGEQLAGKFAINLDADNWTDAYAEDSGIQAAEKSSSVTLNCNHLELSETAQDLYIVVAFGTYTQGLKVTFTVAGDNGKIGMMEKTIGATNGYTLNRNTLTKMPQTTIQPLDQTIVKYELIDRVANLSAGTYYMAGYKNDGTYALALGTISSGQMETAIPVSYANSTLEIGNAVEIVLDAVAGEQNAFYIKINNQYLTSDNKKNGLKLLQPETSNPYWTGIDATDGGIAFKNSTYTGIYMCSSPTAASKYIRGYATQQSRGVYFFKKVSE